MAQEIKVSTGTVRHFPNFPSQFVDARNVDVWLPDGYNNAQNARKKYAVLYMHDGQMLFDSTSTWNHQEWGVDETVGRLMREHKIRDCIVVGISNNGNKRHTEYFPRKAFLNLSEEDKKLLTSNEANPSRPPFVDQEPLSDKYLQFLVTELKPFIDRTFRTKKDRANTFIAGSSMGGLISMYAISEYPQVFGGAACLSTHWIGIVRQENNPFPAAFMRYLQASIPNPRTHKIYFDYGTATLDANYEPSQLEADKIMRAKGYTSANWITKKYEGDDHSERSWRRRLDIPLVFLMKR
jgi:predicted alpha/beta superfamily hydrolase